MECTYSSRLEVKEAQQLSELWNLNRAACGVQRPETSSANLIAAD